MADRNKTYASSNRPAVALITNHGYAGVEIPIGGAQDTGGQVLYVNSLAKALDTLGYKVTIFSRGGFLNFESDVRRVEPEYLTDFARYVFVPGGGDEFIRKEDISVALDEQLNWLDDYIRKEADQQGCAPWDVYELINTHYWDAAVLGVRLIERWRDDLVAEFGCELLADVLDDEAIASWKSERHWRAIGDAPGYHLGSVLLGGEVSTGESAADLAERVLRRFAASASVDPAAAVDNAVASARECAEEGAASSAPPLHPLAVADAVGQGVLDLFPEEHLKLLDELDRIDRHVWTPHSLGSLKQQNFRDQPEDVCRDLKFCERRSHERSVCERTRAFAATSVEIAERMRTHYRVSREQIFYYPPCVDADIFGPRSKEQLASTYEYFSKESGIPVDTLKNARIIIETSRMDQTKRKDVLLDAFAEVAKKYENAYLFIGGGPNNDLFRELKERLDNTPSLAGRAFLLGFVPDDQIGPLFSVGDVYVSASEMEGFGMSVLQAASAGVALVSSDLIPFAVQYVPDDGIIVPAGDVQAFADAMLALLTDDSGRKERIKGLRKVAATLNWESQTEKFIEHLRAGGMQIAEGGSV